ncbi:diguanylate cyclase [Planktothrix sp. FACHB-1355]|uniref:Diguanylate cyclase n=1 Tax=Aerosakkonema funiforme FACHB-1375 TaxID=2949571 RepID=A0A926ZG53_9CYAN|nr:MULTISPECIES: diguanylate cyclase [Oscillatoriales]MBD2181359.1 diguanylate cyclase [Aerosakkonema funiforme FACHB-1375]MBD3557733.1 diguanylate cyclase [Planktothrix sp. FACHB-1355]
MMNEIQAAQKDFGILDRVPEGVCVLREDFSVLFWNRCLEDWTGISRSEILLKDIGIYFPHLHQPKYAHRLMQIFEGGPPTIFSAQLHQSIIPAQLPDGRWRIQHTTVTAVPAGNFRFRTCWDSASGYGFRSHDTGVQLDIVKLRQKPSSSNIEGVGKAGKNKKRVTKYKRIGFVKRNSPLFGDTLKQNEEKLAKVQNRNSFYALLVIEDVTDLTHRIQDYRAMRDRALEEVKERKKIEDALIQSQHFIQKIADATPYLIYIYDLVEKRYIYFNRQVDLLLGYTDEEMIRRGGQLFANSIHPDDLSHLAAQMEKFAIAQDGDILEREYRIKHRSGEWFWFHSRELVFTRTPEGLPKQILGTAEDISKRKWAEEAMRLQTERERLMGVITQHIRQSLNLDEVLNTAVTEVRQFLQTDRALIFRFQCSTHKSSRILKVGNVTVESLAPDCTSIVGNIMPDCCLNSNSFAYYQQGKIRAIEDICSAVNFPKCHIKLLKNWGVKANLEVPIMQGENLWGLLMVQQCKASREWQPLEIELIEQLANQLAIAIQQAELYQQLQAANEQLQRLASSDGLTHLANRRKFDEYLMQQLLILAREKQPLSLILCDIDSFKTYNDTYGHQAGDECLRLVAKAIQRAVKRPADLVARYGGEEFAVILPNTDLKGGLRVAKEIQIRVKDLQIPHTASSVSDTITLSAGLACVIPTADVSPNELVATADRALYQAKKWGRDRIVMYSESCLSQV